MKKNVFIPAVFLTVFGLALSCAKEAPAPEEKLLEPQEEVTTNPSVIKAGIPDAITKVALTDEGVGHGMSLAWQDGDQIRVIATAGGSGNEAFSIKDGFTATSAEFEGTPVEGTAFTVFYPGSYADVAAINARSYTSQVQDGNGSVAHLEWNAIEDVADYGTVTFTHKQNGTLRFTLQLPADFTKVYSLSLYATDGTDAPLSVFSTTNGGGSITDHLDLNLKDGAKDYITLDADKVLTAYMMVSWNDNALPAGTKLLIKVKGDQDDPWVKTKEVASAFTIAGGKVTNIQLNNTNWDEPLFWGGSGTSDDPYQIKTVKHLKNMSSKIKSTAGASKLYFILVDDIDMSGVTDWSYANSGGGNNWPIEFNGNNHTISNFSMTQWSASFFGGLKGEVHHVTFTDAVIATNTETPSRGGLLAFRAGGTDTPAYIHDVTVNGLTVTGTTLAVGGLVGGLECGTIENCTITGLVMNAGAACGGIAGEMYTAASTITGCSVSGTITSTGESVGGIVGIPFGGSQFSGCSFNGSVTGLATVGGLIGGVYANRSYTVSDCHTEGSVEATGKVDHDGEASWVGGLIGIARDNSQVEGIVITNSWSSANVTGNGGVVGGLCGEGVGVRIGRKSGTDVVVEDACEYKNGTLSGGSGTNEFRSTAGMIALPRGSFQCKIYGAKVTNATINAAAHAGGIVGQNRKQYLELEGCLVNGSSISTTGSYVGGILAYANSSDAVIKNNTVSASNYISGGDGFAGGIVGGMGDVSISITGCVFNGVLTANGSNAGGIVGGVTADTNNGTLTITSCNVDGSVTCGGQNVGGVVGRARNQNAISLCKVTGNVTSTYDSGWAYVAGIAANVCSGTVLKCKVTGTITGKRNIIGGVVAYVDWGNLEVAECAFEGTLNVSTDNGIYVGGLVGMVNTNRTLTLHDSFSAGSITTTYGYVGGAVGVTRGNLVMENCYTRSTITAGRGSGVNSLGCLIGGSNNDTATNSSTYNVAKCLSWNDSVEFKQTAAYDGAIIGQVHAATGPWGATTVTSCYYDYDLQSRYTTQNGHALGDEADLTASPGKARYDGHRAPSGKTCSNMASDLGWDSTTIWNLTGDYPALKRVVE